MSNKKLPPEIDNPPSWANDPKAKKEKENWDNEKDLRGQVVKNRVKLLKTVGWIAPTMVIMFSIIFAFSFFAWIWHYLTPECIEKCIEDKSYCLQWLSVEQLSKIQSVIFSGALGAIVSVYIKKQLDTES